MAEIVLVHGGWHGGWCWRPVADRLRMEGHTVYAPSLTGLADRSHLLGPDVGLETHIADIRHLVEWEDLTDVVLVGHSYGGFVTTCVADRIPSRIGALVYLDAFVPEPGTCVADNLSQERLELARTEAQKRGGGWRVSPPDAALWTDDPGLRDWINARTTDHPLRTFEDALTLATDWERVVRKMYIQTERHSETRFRDISRKYERDPNWTVHRLPTFHDAMLTMPDETARLIHSAAPDRSSAQ
ncbi:MAG: alpha/beta hydrolase [Rhodospirillaceae bacterium]|nr:alpha/beta hydrolase [Rhodospirillaceae bacterium]